MTKTTDLCQQLGITYQTLWRWKTGRAKPSHADKLAAQALYQQGKIEDVPEFLALKDDKMS